MVSQEQKKYKPPKLFTKASSVCFVRRIHEQDTTTPFNFKILFLKRNPALRSAAGFWAFPGGKVETQDFLEEYEEVMPTFVEIVATLQLSAETASNPCFWCLHEFVLHTTWHIFFSDLGLFNRHSKLSCQVCLRLWQGYGSVL